jgi:pyruvate dehydrogenase E2 component (dihydrolipoamide acetyltransferase)
MRDFKLPDIGEGIGEAQLISWLVAVGDRLDEGTEVATVSTDKVDVELPSPCAGTVTELLWTPGDTIPVGEVLIRIDDGGAPIVAPTEVVETVAAPAPAPPVEVSPPAAAKPAVAAAIVAAPSVRRFASEHGVDLAALRGSGSDGRILQRDVEAVVTEPARPTAVAEMRPPAGEVERVPLAGPRAVAAERLSHSVHTLAHSTMNFEARGDAVRDLLDKLQPDAERREVKLTPVALIAKCVAAALRDHPRFNAVIDEETGDLLQHAAVHMGIAVAAPSGLVVPVVRDLGRRSLFEVADAVADVAERARQNRLDVADVLGGTFTLSSTGGLERATILSTRPIVNPPQTAILWVSRMTERPRAIDGELTLGPMFSCSVSFDHRYIDGAESTLFVNSVAEMLECPERALA